MAIDVTDVHHAAAEDLAAVLPSEVRDEFVIVVDDLVKPVALRRHEERALLDGVPVAWIALGDGEQTVEGRPQLTAKVPVVQRGGEDDHVRGLVRRIDQIHPVPLHTWVVGVLASAEASETTVDPHVL